MNAALLPQLRVFLAVAKQKSFSGAARELGVSTPAVSQAVKQLETQLRVTLLTRTTRSVALTEVGRRLLENAEPGLAQVLGAMTEVSAAPGETVGGLKLSVPKAALPFAIDPVLPVFRARHPRIGVEVVVEDRLVDIVADGYDAGVRLSETIERDMVQIRMTERFRFAVVASPAYLAKHGEPKRPEDLLQHECINFRTSAGALYAWELERGRRSWRIPVRSSVICNDNVQNAALAEHGLGLAYVFEPGVAERIKKKKLKVVLDEYAPWVPGFFLYFPSRAQRSPALKLFAETVREVTGSRAMPQ